MVDPSSAHQNASFRNALKGALGMGQVAHEEPSIGAMGEDLKSAVAMHGLKAISAQENAKKIQKVQEEESKRKAQQQQVARKKAAQEKAAQERAAQEKASKEKAAQEKAAKEKAAKEKAAKEKAAQEKAAKEKAAQEKAAQEKAARAKALEAKAAREKAAKQKAVRETIEREKAAGDKPKQEAARQAALAESTCDEGSMFRRALTESLSPISAPDDLIPSPTHREMVLQTQFRDLIQRRAQESLSAARVLCHAVFFNVMYGPAKWLHNVRSGIQSECMASKDLKMRSERLLYGWRRHCTEAAAMKERKQLKHMQQALKTREQMSSDVVKMFSEQIAAGKDAGVGAAGKELQAQAAEIAKLQEQLERMKLELSASQDLCNAAEVAAKQDRAARRSKERELREVTSSQEKVTADLTMENTTIKELQATLKEKERTTTNLLADMAKQSDDGENLEI